jgi:hypothetical protein
MQGQHRHRSLALRAVIWLTAAMSLVPAPAIACCPCGMACRCGCAGSTKSCQSGGGGCCGHTGGCCCGKSGACCCARKAPTPAATDGCCGCPREKGSCCRQTHGCCCSKKAQTAGTTCCCCRAKACSHEGTHTCCNPPKVQVTTKARGACRCGRQTNVTSIGSCKSDPHRVRSCQCGGRTGNPDSQQAPINESQIRLTDELASPAPALFEPACEADDRYPIWATRAPCFSAPSCPLCLQLCRLTI